MSHAPKTDSAEPAEEPRRHEPEQPLFKLVIVSSAAFLITVLSMVVTMLFPSESPMSKFINRNGVQMIGVEVVLIIVFGLLAMAFDRRRTLRERQQAGKAVPGSAEGSQSKPGEQH